MHLNRERKPCMSLRPPHQDPPVPSNRYCHRRSIAEPPLRDVLVRLGFPGAKLGSGLGCLKGNPTEVDRLASDLIELSTRHNFAHWLRVGAVYRGWARSASGDTVEGLTWIEQGIRDFRATGSVLVLPYFLTLKAEALHLADRTSEALEAINEAEGLVERFEQRYCYAELHRLRGVFLAALGAEEIFCAVCWRGPAAPITNVSVTTNCVYSKSE